MVGTGVHKWSAPLPYRGFTLRVREATYHQCHNYISHHRHIILNGVIRAKCLVALRKELLYCGGDTPSEGATIMRGRTAQREPQNNQPNKSMYIERATEQNNSQ
jgi:hypothetical protein